MAKYKVTIDHETCIACSVCYNLCPDVFEGNEEGKSVLVEQFRTEAPNVGEIPEDLYQCAKEGEENCPTDSIKVEQIG